MRSRFEIVGRSVAGKAICHSATRCRRVVDLHKPGQLGGISGRIYSLYLGASFAPRIEHAASQIQVSSDLPFPFPMPYHPIIAHGFCLPHHNRSANKGPFPVPPLLRRSSLRSSIGRMTPRNHGSARPSTPNYLPRTPSMRALLPNLPTANSGSSRLCAARHDE
jgi:hypothetical protein